eukprot:2243583-Prymnesium_polylepis.1
MSPERGHQVLGHHALGAVGAMRAARRSCGRVSTWPVWRAGSTPRARGLARPASSRFPLPAFV